MRPDWRTIVPAAALWGLALASCAPSPQAYVAEPLQGSLRIAVLPLANFSEAREAPDRLGPMIGVALSRIGNVEIVEPGRVEEALSKEPWLLIDRLPPDLVDALGAELGANALLQGGVLAYGVRQESAGPVPEVSLSLRLLETPGGRILWSAVHSRGGTDAESVFGFGRVASLEQLAADAVDDIMKTFPAPRAAAPTASPSPAGRERETP